MGIFKITFENFISFRKILFSHMKKLFTKIDFWSILGPLRIFIKSRINVRDLGLRFLLSTRRTLLYGSKTFFRKKKSNSQKLFSSPIYLLTQSITAMYMAFRGVLILRRLLFPPNIAKTRSIERADTKNDIAYIPSKDSESRQLITVSL